MNSSHYLPVCAKAQDITSFNVCFHKAILATVFEMKEDQNEKHI